MPALCDLDVLQPLLVSETTAKMSSTAPDVAIFLRKKSRAANVPLRQRFVLGIRFLALTLTVITPRLSLRLKPDPRRVQLLDEWWRVGEQLSIAQ